MKDYDTDPLEETVAEVINDLYEWHNNWDLSVHSEPAEDVATARKKLERAVEGIEDE